MFTITNRFRIFLCVGTLLCGCATASAGHRPDHEGEPLPSEQAGGEKRLMPMLAEARALAQRESWDAAVRNYLHVFNYGRGITRLEIVRLALIPVEIAALGEKFPPALRALREEVRVRAGLILTDVAGTDEILELLSLNRALNQPQRSLELYDQLKNNGERSREMRLRMREVLTQELLDARRFDEMGEQLVGLARQIAERMATLEIEAEFGVASSDLLSARRASVASAAPQVYEALLSTAHDEVAAKLADRLLRFDHSNASYTALVSAAMQAQQPEIAQQLLRRASADLNAEELADLKKLLP